MALPHDAKTIETVKAALKEQMMKDGKSKTYQHKGYLFAAEPFEAIYMHAAITKHENALRTVHMATGDSIFPIRMARAIAARRMVNKPKLGCMS